jgi:hypothetical protein
MEVERIDIVRGEVLEVLEEGVCVITTTQHQVFDFCMGLYIHQNSNFPSANLLLYS